MSEDRKFPVVRYNDAGLETYREEENGYSVKRDYDEQGRQIYWETNRGGWAKHKYDDAGREIYYENSDGFWFKAEYNDAGFRTHYEDSTGKIQTFKDSSVAEVIKDATERSEAHATGEEKINVDLEK